MNIYLFEWKAQAKNALLWTAAVLAVLLLFMAGIYPIFRGSLDEVLRIMSGFPPEFSAAFGFDVAGMFDIGGFYSFTFSYVSLVGAMMAVATGVSTFSRESRSKCVDFLLTRPVSRAAVFWYKLLSNLVWFFLMNVIYVLVCLFLLQEENIDRKTAVLAGLALLFTQLVFFSVGILFSAAAKRVRSVSGIAAAFGFAAFILSALVNIMKEEKIRYLAPLKYFDPAALFFYGAFDTAYAFTGVLVSLICLFAAFWLFQKRDVHAV